uniref:Chemotaxis protein CheA n=1 Tax=Candidatus Methanogaster sp. ANME-2c ERB4 TaxID=2759911 RepID=A0A7G9YM13_9EURY|nr:chemotaxis protein CheA [Methanosarcinales archaeon ANME-2c ERB4]
MDMSEYKGEFVNEAREHLEILNQSLLDLEHDQSNTDLLNNIFRAAHTLKGSSATMGYTNVNTLTHRMENVLDAIRQGVAEATSATVDALFDCFDTLEIMIDAIDANDVSDVDVSELASRLEALLTEGAKTGTEAADVAETAATAETISDEAALQEVHEVDAEVPQEPESPQSPGEHEQVTAFTEDEMGAASDAANRGISVFKLSIALEDTCALKSVRAVMILKSISEHADILATTPDAEGIEDGEFGRGFDVIIGTSETGDMVKEAVERVNEVEQVGILAREPDTQPAADAAVSGTTDTTDTTDTVGETNTSGEIASAEVAAPPPPPTAAASSKKPEVVRSVQSVRVNIEKLDALVNMVGELVINKIRLLQIQSTHRIKELDETVSNIDRLTNDLRDEVMEMRMVAVAQVFNRFPRMIRDLAKKKGKDIDLVVIGKEIELDRTVLDEVGEPLVHLLRNCVDHGIEPPEVRTSAGKAGAGVITLAARRQKNHVEIEVSDDGFGMDPDKLRAKAIEKGIISPEEAEVMSDENALLLIFAPGFSTAETITDISGRGVGMDVVKTSIEALGGTVNIKSDLGCGTTVTLQLPLTMAIIQTLLVEVGGTVYAVPISSVLETISVMPDTIRTMGTQKLTTLRGNVLPLVWVHDLFGIYSENGHDEVVAVVVDRGGQHVGLVVDSLIGQQEIAIKSLDGVLAGIKGFAGATILGDGRVIMILDVASMV